MSEHEVSGQPNTEKADIAVNRIPMSNTSPNLTRLGGGVWAAAVLAVPVGLFAAAYTYFNGGSILAALSYYSIVGVLCLLASLTLLYFLAPWSELDPSVARPLAQPRAKDLKKAPTARSVNAWVQWNPNGLAISDQRIFCVSSAHSLSIGSQLARIISERGYGVDLCNCLETAVSTIVINPDMWYAMIVDLDECELQAEVEDVVSSLSAFRVAAPKVVVMLFSENFARDDLETSRLSIADISLRAPLSAFRILENFPFAHSNNQAWQDRLNEVVQGHLSQVSLKSSNVVDLSEFSEMRSQARSKATPVSNDK